MQLITTNVLCGVHLLSFTVTSSSVRTFILFLNTCTEWRNYAGVNCRSSAWGYVENVKMSTFSVLLNSLVFPHRITQVESTQAIITLSSQHQACTASHQKCTPL